MRYAIIAALAGVVTSASWAQPVPKPADDQKKNGAHFWQHWPAQGWLPANDPNMTGACFKLEVLGFLRIWKQIDTDPKVMRMYSRDSGIEIHADEGHHLIRGFELFLGGDPEFVKMAKRLDRTWVVVEGDLVIVHGPIQYQFGTGLESLGQTEYAHPRPRYVINARRMSAAPDGVPNAKQAPYIKIDVRGVLNTVGKNPTLRDISAGKAWPSSVIRTDQCNMLLYLGKDDKWLARAKELNGKAAVARGELIDVGREAPPDRPFGIVPLPFYLLNVTDLQPAPAAPDKEDKKK